MKGSLFLGTATAAVITLLTLQGATADFCGQHDVYQKRGGELLTRRDGGIDYWNSSILKKDLFSARWNRGVKTLYMEWNPTTTYPVVTVEFYNGALATYYSTDGEVCDVAIHNPAAYVKIVTARP